VIVSRWRWDTHPGPSWNRTMACPQKVSAGVSPKSLGALVMREEGFEPSRLAAQEPKSCVSAVPPLSRFDGFRFYSGPPDRSIVGSEVAGLPSSDRPVGGRLAGVDGLGPWSEVPWRDDAT